MGKEARSKQEWRLWSTIQYGDGLIAELHWSGGQLYWLVGGVVI